jgi:hypothetical protein
MMSHVHRHCLAADHIDDDAGRGEPGRLTVLLDELRAEIGNFEPINRRGPGIASRGGNPL